jgi:hypothetical protein
MKGHEIVKHKLSFATGTDMHSHVYPRNEYRYQQLAIIPEPVVFLPESTACFSK